MFGWIPYASIAISALVSFASTPAERVDETLGAMEAAVRNNDLGAFMSQVSTNDLVMTTETRAWFEDLSRNPVSEFKIEPKEDLIVGITDQSAMMQIRVHWTLESDEIDRSVDFNAIFVPMAGEASGPWLFAGKAWEYKNALEDGSRVMSAKKHHELAQDVAIAAPEIQRKIELALGCEVHHPLTIKIYPSMQQLQFSISMGYLNPISGWNEPGESIKILGRKSTSAREISSLLAHEIGHAVSFEFGEQIIDAPWWSLEGIAELVADEYRSTSAQEREVAIAKQVSRGDRRTWDQLADFKGEALNHSNYVYSQGWSMVRYITNRFGSKARNKWFVAMARGLSVEDATQEVLGIEFADLDRAWEAEMLSIAQQAEDDADD
jgi:Peptidase MA superfamily